MTVSTDPGVSVLIVCHNSGAYLPRCLEALARQTHTDFEVIIIDNGSSDGSISLMMAAETGLRLRVEQLQANMGFAAANNRGAQLARAPWLALLNSDAFPAADWLEQLVKAAGSHPRSFFASRQIQANRPELLDGEGDVYYTSGLALRYNYNRRFAEAGPPREVFSACAAAALYPRAEFLAAGGFDEDYFAYHEDIDLGFRLRLRGLRCILVPTAVVRHVGAGTTGTRSAFAIYHGHRNLVWTFVKNMPEPWLWLYMPLHIAVNLLSMVYFVLAGHAASIFRAKVDAVRGLPRAWAKRKLVQAGRSIAGSAVVYQMNRNPFGPLDGWIRRQWPDLR